MRLMKAVGMAMLMSVGLATSAPAEANHAPIADDQLVSTNEDTPIDVLLTASDVDGDPLTYSVATAPSQGRLLCAGPNCTYSPNPDFHGNDQFLYAVRDTSGAEDTGRVDLMVTSVNDPPVALNSDVATYVNTSVDIVLTAADADGDPLEYSVAVLPAHGAVTCQAARCTYTPSRDYYGSDALRFQARDPSGASAQATVTLLIVRSQAPPFTAAVTGERPGPVTVGAGESVLITNAQVTGSITVNPGGSVTLVDSRISGGISANAPAFLRLCGTRVAAPSSGVALAVADGDMVLAGDPADGCAGNGFGGQVSLRNNNLVVFGANAVSQGATINDGGPGVTIVKANNVVGTLGCTGNNPMPTNAGQANIARSKTGQCAGL